MKSIQIINQKRSSVIPIHATLCDTFLSRLRGLMFRSHLDCDEGILLDEKNDSVINTAIHMLFMNFDIAAVWINHDFTVVDVKIARRWRPIYSPISPARYTLEIHPSRFDDFRIGEVVSILPS